MTQCKPSKNHTLHFATPIISPRSNPPLDPPSHTLNHPHQVAVILAVEIAPRAGSALRAVVFRWLLGCAIAKGRAVVETHEWLARLGDDDPDVLAVFVLEAG